MTAVILVGCALGYLLLAVVTATVSVAMLPNKDDSADSFTAFWTGVAWPLTMVFAALYQIGKGVAWLIWHGAHRLNPQLRKWQA